MQAKHFSHILALTSTAGLTHADAAFVAGASVRLVLTLGLCEAAASDGVSHRNARHRVPALHSPRDQCVVEKTHERQRAKHPARRHAAGCVWQPPVIARLSRVVERSCDQVAHCSFFVK